MRVNKALHLGYFCSSRFVYENLKDFNSIHANAMIRRMRIGIDIGGTKIEGIVLDSRGQERARRRVPTPTGDYSATVRAVSDLVDDLSHVTNLDTSIPIGVGIPVHYVQRPLQ